MIHTSVSDIGLAYYAVFSILLDLTAFALVVLLEAAVLRKMKWDSFWRSFRDSLVINLFSAIVGLILRFSFPPWDIFSDMPSSFLRVVLLWALSVLIEGALLSIIRHRPMKESFHAAFFANISSYVLLALLRLVLWY
jgi:hypothetical protein